MVISRTTSIVIYYSSVNIVDYFCPIERFTERLAPYEIFEAHTGLEFETTPHLVLYIRYLA